MERIQSRKLTTSILRFQTFYRSYRSFQIVPEVTEPDDFKPTEAPVAPNNEAAEARFDSASVSGCLNYKGESVPYIINRFQ